MDQNATTTILSPCSTGSEWLHTRSPQHEHEAHGLQNGQDATLGWLRFLGERREVMCK